jgi:hypothetical protein
VAINHSGAPATVVNESGLYSLVLTSRKPDAKRFKKWITSEVIPSIRKTGGYGAAATSETTDGVRYDPEETSHFSNSQKFCAADFEPAVNSVAPGKKEGGASHRDIDCAPECASAGALRVRFARYHQTIGEPSTWQAPGDVRD